MQDAEVHELSLVGDAQLLHDDLDLPWVGAGTVGEDLDWLDHVLFCILRLYMRTVKYRKKLFVLG